jgi:hypothetical protein
MQAHEVESAIIEEVEEGEIVEETNEYGRLMSRVRAVVHEMRRAVAHSRPAYRRASYHGHPPQGEQSHALSQTPSNRLHSRRVRRHTTINAHGGTYSIAPGLAASR